MGVVELVKADRQPQKCGSIVVKWPGVTSICPAFLGGGDSPGTRPAQPTGLSSSAQILHQKGYKKSRLGTVRDDCWQQPAAKTLPCSQPSHASLSSRGGTGERRGKCPSLCRKPWRLWPLQTEPLSGAERLRIVPFSRGLPPLHLFTTHPVFLSVCFTHHRLH